MTRRTDSRGHTVVFANPKIDQLAVGIIRQCLTLRTFDLLKLVYGRAFPVTRATNAICEQLLEIWFLGNDRGHVSSIL